MATSIVRQLRQYDAWIKWISIAVIGVSVLVLARTLPTSRIVTAGAEWIEGLGPWGPVVYGLLYVVATVLFVPGSIPTMAAGAIFGLWTGVLTAWIGSTIGAMVAFLIARHMAREKVAEVARRRPKFEAIDHAVGEGGWKIVALLRLSPVMPFNVQNYLYGLTQIRFWPCLLATFLAMLPGTFLFVYIGHLAGVAVAGERQGSAWEGPMLVVGLLTTAAVTVYLTILARRKLREQSKIVEEMEEVTSTEETQPEFEDEDADENCRDRPQADKWPWGAAVAAVLALLLLALAVYAQWNSEAIEDLLTWPLATTKQLPGTRSSP